MSEDTETPAPFEVPDFAGKNFGNPDPRKRKSQGWGAPCRDAGASFGDRPFGSGREQIPASEGE